MSVTITGPCFLFAGVFFFIYLIHLKLLDFLCRIFRAFVGGKRTNNWQTQDGLRHVNEWW